MRVNPERHAGSARVGGTNDRHVRVSVLPQIEQRLVGRAARVHIAAAGGSAGAAERRQRVQRHRSGIEVLGDEHALVVENLPELDAARSRRHPAAGRPGLEDTTARATRWCPARRAPRSSIGPRRGRSPRWIASAACTIGSQDDLKNELSGNRRTISSASLPARFESPQMATASALQLRACRPRDNARARVAASSASRQLP